MRWKLKESVWEKERECVCVCVFACLCVCVFACVCVYVWERDSEIYVEVIDQSGINMNETDRNKIGNKSKTLTIKNHKQEERKDK